MNNTHALILLVSKNHCTHGGAFLSQKLNLPKFSIALKLDNISFNSRQSISAKQMQMLLLMLFGYDCDKSSSNYCRAGDH